jgi:hypothetical protein
MTRKIGADPTAGRHGDSRGPARSDGGDTTPDDHVADEGDPLAADTKSGGDVAGFRLAPEPVT